MTLVSNRHWDNDPFWRDWPARRWSSWDTTWRDRFSHDWEDWPVDWPRPRDLLDRFRSHDTDRLWRDWPSDWPRMDAVMPRFSSYLDRFDRDWRSDPFWRDLYPRWAEPVFKDGIDVKTNVTNDSQRFAVEIDCYQFRPEELQVKTLDDTLLIEGRHEDVRDRDNYTKMYFVRKYQLPTDVDLQSIGSHVDSNGRLTVEAQKRWQSVEGRERAIPIESQSSNRRFGATSRSSSYSPRDQFFYDSGRGTASDYYRGDSRGGVVGGGDYLLSPKNGGYKSEYEQRQTDANGMRHEARREEFREEFRRTGSAANALSPPAPIYCPPSRLSAVDSTGGGSHRSESHFRRTASASRNEYREGYNGADHLLRPAEELGGRSSVFGRSVPIQRA
ncbi:SHSP domain-containing protein [Meloidogyne graminicola]|uniref:SHSP domain-containing protein n=1 Tax=Meloidogyne graminicola TaxID=189291 RepID=A0A8S9ZNM2_9BILA|nr:SHSP domain-containing protein [Meloidogyne graminicola]